jgi:hypothetical protein
MTRQIEPRELEIQELKAQVAKMDQELATYHSTNLALNLEVAMAFAISLIPADWVIEVEAVCCREGRWHLAREEHGLADSDCPLSVGPAACGKGHTKPKGPRDSGEGASG